jgi:hypothetical protein
MSEKHAIIIAVERYHEGKFTQVFYAENDASAFSAAIEALGFPRDRQTILVNADATKARIDSALRRVTQHLVQDDVLYVYYAGHGFSDAGTNYLTCYDSVWRDLSRTSLPTQDVFRYLRESTSRRVAVFLDCCHSGIQPDLSERGMLDHLNNEELTAFFARSEYHVCFCSCRDDQKSHPITALKHGAWTASLLKALRGEAKEAFARENIVTAASLQNFLSDDVPRALRRAYQDIRAQTPLLYGHVTSDFMVADVTPAVNARRAAAQPVSRELRRAVLGALRNSTIKGLTGFRKGVHHVPRAADARADAFVHSVGDADLRSEVEAVHARIKEQFRYKRKDVEVELAAGSGTIIAPDFTYSLSFAVDPNDLGSVTWRTDVMNIATREVFDSDGLRAVFPAGFRTLELQYGAPIDVSALIDAIEDADLPDVELEYPPDAVTCTIRFAGWKFALHIDPGTLRLEFDQRAAPAALLQGFEEVRQFVGAKNLPLLAR